jgi:hypothetical protein
MNKNKILMRRRFEEKGEKEKGYENINNIYIYIYNYISKMGTFKFIIYFEYNWHKI